MNRADLIERVERLRRNARHTTITNSHDHGVRTLQTREPLDEMRHIDRTCEMPDKWRELWKWAVARIEYLTATPADLMAPSRAERVIDVRLVRACQQAGVDPVVFRKMNHGTPHESAERRKVILCLRRAGVSYDGIARVTAMAKSSVIAACKAGARSPGVSGGGEKETTSGN